MVVLAEARHTLERHGWPRLQASLIVLAAGGAACLASVALLTAGVHSMAARYALAAVTGYGVFILLIRLWIAWQRGDVDLLPDLGHLGRPTTAVRTTGGPPRTPLFGGGRSGGGGAGASFAGAPAPQPAASAFVRTNGGGFSLGDWSDADEGLWIVLAVALALSSP